MRQGAGPLGHKPEIRAQSHQERQQAQGASEQGQGPAGLHGGEGWVSESWVMKSQVIQIPGSLRKEEALPPGLLGDSSSWGSWGTCGPSDQISLVSPSSWQLTLVTHPLFPACIGTRPPPLEVLLTVYGGGRALEMSHCQWFGWVECVSTAPSEPSTPEGASCKR